MTAVALLLVLLAAAPPVIAIESVDERQVNASGATLGGLASALALQGAAVFVRGEGAPACGERCVGLRVARQGPSTFSVEARYQGRATLTRLELPPGSDFEQLCALAIQARLVVDALVAASPAPAPAPQGHPRPRAESEGRAAVPSPAPPGEPAELSPAPLPPPEDPPVAAEVPVEEAVRPRAPIVPPGEHPRAPPPVEVSEHQSAWYLGLSGCAFGGKGLPTTGGALVEARVLAGEYRLQLSVGLLAVRVVDSEAGRYRYQAIPALLTISRPLPFAGWLEPGLGVAATWASSERAAADFDAVSRLLPGVAATATARLSVGRLNVALGLWSLAQAPQRQLDDEGQVVFEYPALSAGGSLGVEIGE